MSEKLEPIILRVHRLGTSDYIEVHMLLLMMINMKPHEFSDRSLIAKDRETMFVDLHYDGDKFLTAFEKSYGDEPVLDWHLEECADLAGAHENARGQSITIH